MMKTVGCESLEALAPGMPFEHKVLLRQVAKNVSPVIGLVNPILGQSNEGQQPPQLVATSFDTRVPKPSLSALYQLPRLWVVRRPVKSFGVVYDADVVRVPHVLPNTERYELLCGLGFHMVVGSSVLELRF